MQLAQYIRMSTNLQEDSPETQKSIIKEYCQRHNHTIVKTYIDAGISGGSMEKRNALIEMLLDAEQHLFEGIVVYKYDRAFRNLGEQVVTLKRLKKHGITVLSVADPSAEGASGELIVNILGAVAQFERQLTGERIYDKNRRLTKEGRWTGSGHEPMGYTYDKKSKSLNIVEDEAETVRFIYETYLKEKSINRVMEKLYDFDKKTKTGKDWTDVGIHALLTNPLYSGKLRWGYYSRGKKGGKNRNCEVYDGNHEPIISFEKFSMVQEILKLNRTRTAGNTGQPSLLSGFLRCSKCGGIVCSNYLKRLSKYTYYCKMRYSHKDVCSGWNKIGYKIDTAVYLALIQNIQQVNDAMSWDSSNKKPVHSNKKQIEKKLHIIEAKLSRQIEMYEEGIINKELFLKRRTSTLEEKKQLEKEIKDSTEKPVNQDVLNLIGTISGLWDTYDIKAKREFLSELIEFVYTDGKTAKIAFRQIRLPGWSIEIETPII